MDGSGLRVIGFQTEDSKAGIGNCRGEKSCGILTDQRLDQPGKEISQETHEFWPSKDGYGGFGGWPEHCRNKLLHYRLRIRPRLETCQLPNQLSACLIQSHEGRRTCFTLAVCRNHMFNFRFVVCQQKLCCMDVKL